jgi:hypothetical protein
MRVYIPNLKTMGHANFLEKNQRLQHHIQVVTLKIISRRIMYNSFLKNK